MCDKYEMLINLIRGYPHLYDKSNRNFKDAEMKLNSWKQISEDLQMTVQDCQRIWLNLKNKFGREKKALPSGSGAPVTPQWEYLDSMSFLNAFVKPRNTHTTTPKVLKPTTTTTFCDPPIQSPIFIDLSSGCSRGWSNSTMVENPLGSSTQDNMLSPNNANENEECSRRNVQDDFRYEENLFVQLKELEEPAPTANSETVQIGSKGKNKNKIKEADDTCKEIVDVAKSITLQLKSLAEKRQEPKTSADVLGEYITTILKEMPPEKQKIKRRRLLEVLEDD